MLLLTKGCGEGSCGGGAGGLTVRLEHGNREEATRGRRLGAGVEGRGWGARARSEPLKPPPGGWAGLWRQQPARVWGEGAGGMTISELPAGDAGQGGERREALLGGGQRLGGQGGEGQLQEEP